MPALPSATAPGVSRTRPSDSSPNTSQQGDPIGLHAHAGHPRTLPPPGHRREGRHPPPPGPASHGRPRWRHTNSKAQAGGGHAIKRDKVVTPTPAYLTLHLGRYWTLVAEVADVELTAEEAKARIIALADRAVAEAGLPAGRWPRHAPEAP
jgi:hypothetical protein